MNGMGRVSVGIALRGRSRGDAGRLGGFGLDCFATVETVFTDSASASLSLHHNGVGESFGSGLSLSFLASSDRFHLGLARFSSSLYVRHSERVPLRVNFYALILQNRETNRFEEWKSHVKRMLNSHDSF